MLFHSLIRISSHQGVPGTLSSCSHLHCLHASSGGTPVEHGAQTHTELRSGPAAGTCAAFSAYAGTSEYQHPVRVRKRRDANNNLLMNFITMLGYLTVMLALNPLIGGHALVTHMTSELTSA